MNEFLQHLRDMDIVKSGVFSISELDEAILSVYNNIQWAARDQCDTIEVTANRITRSRGGQKIRDKKTPVDFRPAFQKIISRDQVVRAHLRIVEDTAEKTTYKLA